MAATHPPSRCSRLIVVIDGLRCDAIGAFGNTWFETPAFDQLAAESTAFDWAFVETPSAEGFYRMEVKHLVAGSVTGEPGTLLTDDADVASLARASGCNRVELLPSEPPQSAADEVSTTRIASFFAQATEWILAHEGLFTSGSPTGTIAWLHCGAMTRGWDAPLEIRNRLLDPEDPPPPTGCDVPHLETNRLDDPDTVFGWRAVYGAEIVALDECVGAFVTALRESGILDASVLALAGMRGTSLGEHDRVGLPESGPLYGEEIHVPCLVREPGQPISRRCDRLVSLPDLLARVAAGDGLETIATERILAARGGHFGIRTAHWYLASVGDANEAEHGTNDVALFVKPDDRYEQNDVASRCRAEIDELLAVRRGDATRM